MANELNWMAEKARVVFRGPAGKVLQPAHRWLMSAMIAGVGVRDAVRFRGAADARLTTQVTIAVKTFERPRAIARFVRSARRVFAGRIVVADDSRQPWQSRDPHVTVLPLPFNSGVSFGRNSALDAVTTPYVLICDDDFVFTHATRWESALEYLERHREVDAVAGLQIEVPRWYSLVFDGDPLFPGHETPLVAPGTIIDGLPVRLMTPQAYLARTASIQAVRWNESLRVVDHRDFFSRAAGRLVFVQDEAIPVFHARTPWNRFFTTYREDTAADLAWLGQFWRG